LRGTFQGGLTPPIKKTHNFGPPGGNWGKRENPPLKMGGAAPPFAPKKPGPLAPREKNPGIKNHYRRASWGGPPL